MRERGTMNGNKSEHTGMNRNDEEMFILRGAWGQTLWIEIKYIDYDQW